jgi:hypothetical protein
MSPQDTKTTLGSKITDETLGEGQLLSSKECGYEYEDGMATEHNWARVPRNTMGSYDGDEQ